MTALNISGLYVVAECI